MPPKPSTVPMRVSVEMVGSGTPLRMRNLDWSTLGKFSGQRLEGDVEDRRGELLDRAAASHASMAGQRLSVRGDT